MSDLLPTLYPIVAASSAVTNLIGSPPRFYKHGRAPQQVVAPYATQRAVTVTPENDLTDTPRADYTRVQVSVWSVNSGTGATGVETLAKAFRDTFEPKYDVADIRDMGQDPETSRFRIDIDVIVWNHRANESSSL